MKAPLVIVLLLSVFGTYAQQYLLPALEEGKWQLRDTNGVLVKETPYSYIHTFDLSGTTFFAGNGGFGLLDAQGNELLPGAYEEVRQLGGGNYALRTASGWIRFAGNKPLPDTLQSFEPINNYWAVVGKRDSVMLLNLPSSKTWQLSDSSTQVSYLHDFVYIKYNEALQRLIDPNGNVIYQGRFSYEESNNVFHISTRDSFNYIFDAKGAWNLGNPSEVVLHDQGFFVRTGKNGAFYSFNRQKELSGDFTDIRVLNARCYYVAADTLVTLFDRTTKKQLLPFRYEEIEISGDSAYMVYRGGDVGLLDQDFRELLPCKYSRFSVQNDLVRTYSVSYSGIYSFKQRREILPAVYDYIERKGNRFKASRSNLVTIVEMDDQHRITDRISIDNVVNVLQIDRAGYSRPRREIDKRLFSLGWFIDSTLVTPKKGTPFYQLTWGLYGNGDSTILKPANRSLIYVPQSPFTVHYVGDQDWQLSETNIQKMGSYRLINHTTGKTGNDNLVSYDSTDFLSHSYMRASTLEDFVILRDGANTRHFAYLEHGNSPYPRFCNAKEIKVTKKEEPDMTDFPNIYFSRWGYMNRYIATSTTPFLGKGLLYPDGKWNFLDHDGNNLLTDTFSFVHPFLGNQAIVRKGKAWGVVTPDTIIIPTIYSEVKRTILGTDTLFIAKLGQKGTRILNTSAQLLGKYNVIKSRNNVVLIEDKGKKILLDNQLKPLIQDYSGLKILKNDYILAKNKKEFTLFDPDGKQLCSIPDDPEMILFDRFVVVKSGSSFQVRDFENTLIMDNCNSFDENGKLIRITSEGKQVVYNDRLQPVLKKINGTIIADEVSGQFAVVDGEKITVYDNEGAEVSKCKGVSPSQFANGHLIVTQGDSTGVWTTDGQRVIRCGEIEEVQLLGNGHVFLKQQTGPNLLFDEKWQPVLNTETKFRSLRYCGENVIAFGGKNGKLVLYNCGSHQRDTNSYTEARGTFSNGRLLVKKGSGYTYITTDLEPITGCTFPQAEPFKGPFAAVGNKIGWTIIDSTGRALCYPNFGAISPLTDELFQTGSLPFYGLFNAKGEQLLPVEYEQIRFLPHNIIQTVKEGELRYFHMDGQPLFK